MTNLICPLCKRLLIKSNNSLKCAFGHTFDISKHNYVNFLTHGKSHGDNKEMIISRRDFLDKGYYEDLQKAVGYEIGKLKNIQSYLDAGCGEGYYTQEISSVLNSEDIWALDISKDALIQANKRLKNTNYIVGSVYDMPFFQDNSFDLVSSIFSPFAAKEINRVLKKGGYLLSVIPGKLHLFGLKKLIYDNPYANAVKDFAEEGFEFVSNTDIEYDITIDKDTALTLWKMTPYYYRTPKSGMERLNNIDKITTPVSFHIVIYKALKE